MENRKRLEALDNIELLSVQQQVSDFPEHFHETFCISLIGRGTEIIKSGNNNLFTTAGNISISNPFEIHANPILDKDVKIGFDTIYLAQPLVDYLLGIENAQFENVQTFSIKQIILFNYIKSSVENKLFSELEIYLKYFLNTLDSKTQPVNQNMFNQSNKYADILSHIDSNYQHKISLEKLAKIACMDKYNFSKAFRKATGLSPMNYVLMKKIFYAKSLIKKDSILIEIVYELDFTDQSHFNKQFKRFVGISPSAFQANL
jgi:AraC-like DNA-binding protein